MTNKVFWDDPYLSRLQTHIASVDGAIVTLDETIFFGFSGGQESDAGTIAGYKVIDARKDGLQIYYTLDDTHALRVGDEVVVEIDAARRKSLMRHHFAAEAVLEVASKALPDSTKIGSHISADKARIDFIWSENVAPKLREIREAVQQIIDADLPIKKGFSDAVNQRRYWEVDGFARVACGGTHLNRTAEVGEIKLKRKNIGKNKERIEITLS